MDMLTVSHVSKAFGRKKVVEELSFSVPEHTIFGFIGRNGAGKTTTMKMILGLLKMDSGEIAVNGVQVKFGENQTNQYIGYLPDVPEFYDFMTPMEYLGLCGNITGMSKEQIQSRAEELLRLVGLADEKRRIRGFSRGMKQRLGIAQALLNRPKVLICDEPTSALDPVGRKEILDILLAAKKETTIIFSTHILSDVERICDEIAFLSDGKIVLQGTLEEVKNMHGITEVEIEFVKESDLELFSRAYPDGRCAGRNKLVYDKRTEKDMLAMMEFLVRHHICAQRIEMLEPTLEKLFMEVVEK